MASRTARQSKSTERSADLFVSGVDHIEVIGSGMVRLSFFVNIAGESGRLESVVADFAVVTPLSALPDAIGKAIATTARTIIASADGSVVLLQ